MQKTQAEIDEELKNGIISQFETNYHPDPEKMWDPENEDTQDKVQSAVITPAEKSPFPRRTNLDNFSKKELKAFTSWLADAYDD